MIEQQNLLNEINNQKAELKELMECYNQGVCDSSEKVNPPSDKNDNTCSILQNIENFFVVNDKVYLVDTEKNLYHLKKCKKYEKFTNENKFKNKEENLMAYLDCLQNHAKNPIDNNIESGNDITDRDKEKNEKQADTSFVVSD
jgi:hypothetical protein